MAGPRRPIDWSSDARSDLSKIWDYYVRVAGRHTAEKIIREIGEACRILEDHPFAGRSRNEVRPGLRSVAVSPHVIFYRVKGGAAEVARVLDGRQDLDEIFARDPGDEFR
jgi:toxin ParE1/3/4